MKKFKLNNLIASIFTKVNSLRMVGKINKKTEKVKEDNLEKLRIKKIL